MYDLPSNTMLTYLSNPMFEAMDFSELPVSALADEINRFWAASKGMPAPETDALKFYFLNHAFHVMKTKFNALEELSPDMVQVAETHIRETNEIAKRLFCYSAVIAVEEARFLPEQGQGFFDLLKSSYGMEFHDYVKNRFQVKGGQGSGNGRRGDLTSFGGLNMTCGQFASAMVSVFAFGKWNPGFGGKGWVPIASLVRDCVGGSISFEGMADQAFSLCHNNGSMFNKGHLYGHYTQFIYNILDIQDSGQIPQWIASNAGNKFIDKDLKAVHDLMAKRFPDEMTGPVNSSLIKNSEAARTKKAQALAKKNAATWNNTYNQQADEPAKKAPPQSRMDNILMNDFKKGLL